MIHRNLLLSVVCVLMAFPDDVFSEIPSTYIGSWELDLERTFTIHFKKQSEEHPEIFGSEKAEEAISSLATSVAVSGSEVVLIITDDEVISRQVSSDLERTSQYRVISGSSDHVEIEVTTPGEEVMFSTILLVDGGIAISQENCSDDPERCARRQRKGLENAQKKMREKLRDKMQKELPDSGKNAYDPSAARLVIQADVGPHNDHQAQTTKPPLSKQPEWFYFKKRRDLR